MTKALKYRIKVEEGLYYPYSENKGADQLSSNCELICAFVFAYAKNGFLITGLILLTIKSFSVHF